MNTTYIKTIVYLVIIVQFLSCTKEITVNVAHEPQTVIYGELNNIPQPVTISIQETLPLSATTSFKPVNDARISLYEKDVNGIITLISDQFNSNQGIYRSAQPITATIGDSYWIEVTLNNGTQFKSAEEILKPIVSIKSIEVSQEFDDVLNINFSDPGTTTNFYKATVKLFNNGVLISSNSVESNDVLFNGNEEASLGVDLFSFNDDDTQVFPEYNMIEANLENINFSSYQFLLNQSAQNEANEDAGDSSSGDPSQLFSTPPVNLLGNITNVSTNSRALGNFTIASLSSENQNVSNQ